MDDRVQNRGQAEALSLKDIEGCIKDRQNAALMLIDTDTIDWLRGVELELGMRKPDAFAHGIKIIKSYAKPRNSISSLVNIKVMDTVPLDQIVLVSSLNGYKPHIKTWRNIGL